MMVLGAIAVINLSRNSVAEWFLKICFSDSISKEVKSEMVGNSHRGGAGSKDTCAAGKVGYNT